MIRERANALLLSYVILTNILLFSTANIGRILYFAALVANSATPVG